jgi:hypothetical protein
MSICRVSEESAVCMSGCSFISHTKHEFLLLHYWLANLPALLLPTLFIVDDLQLFTSHALFFIAT